MKSAVELDINTITGMLLERLMQKTDQYHLLWSDRFMITTASALHDIGKIGIDEKILNKPGKLTKEEFEIMKTHTLIGASMLVWKCSGMKNWYRLHTRSAGGTMSGMMEKGIRTD